LNSTPDRIFALMHSLELAAQPDELTVTPLTGGVSSDIVLVETARGRYCAKFALPKLKVAADWQVPVSRNAAEYDWLRYAARIDPNSVPPLFGQNAELGGFVMAFLPSDSFPNWKARLMAGRVDVAFSMSVGQALGQIHAASAQDSSVATTFPHQANFHALRLEPYLLHTATRHPDLSSHLHDLAHRIDGARIALVHGDISPKNILCGPDGPVFLDAECAVHGDPAFDPAFCLNHLLIKASAAMANPADLADAARALWSAYKARINWEDPDTAEIRVAALLPALMLARVDGKSPVEYLDPIGQNRLRQLARSLLAARPDRIAPIIAAAQNAGDSI
jgi:aminoglycoside phosphotransferase (APT) family kinase protein